MKEKYTIQLHSVFFINKTKDLQCIHPRKICMKCYLLMNTASKRSSTILLKTYENWCPHDEHDCGTCVRITELSKEALGKIKNTSQNERRGRHLFQNYSGPRKTSTCSVHAHWHTPRPRTFWFAWNVTFSVVVISFVTRP